MRFFAIRFAAATAALLLFFEPARAHHVMGGRLPSTSWEGFLSGLGHPIIGFDHLAFIVGVGLISYPVRRTIILPLVFVAGTVVGCLIHVGNVTLPWTEPVVAITLGAVALLVILPTWVGVGLLTVLFAGFGVFHGYAYGESIVGAETRPLVSYVVGFGVIQFSLAIGTAAAIRWLVTEGHVRELIAMRVCSGGMAAVAVLTAANLLTG